MYINQCVCFWYDDHCFHVNLLELCRKFRNETEWQMTTRSTVVSRDLSFITIVMNISIDRSKPVWRLISWRIVSAWQLIHLFITAWGANIFISLKTSPCDSQSRYFVIYRDDLDSYLRCIRLSKSWQEILVQW